MMRLAFSCDDDRGLGGVLAYHFGRCPFYTFVDVDDDDIKRVEVVPNPYYAQHAPGVVPEFIHRHGAQVMITGGMGARAVAFFDQYGIQVVTGASGTVRYALERYLAGELQGSQPCGGRAQRQPISAPRAPSQATEPESERDELARLREEVTALRQELASVLERLEQLGQK